MYAIIERKSLALIQVSDDLKGLTEEFDGLSRLSVNTDNDQTFTPFTTLELKILYRALGQVPGTVINNRDSIVRSICKLIRYRPTSDSYQPSVFAVQPVTKPVTVPTQAPTGRDRQGANAVAPAPKGSTRATIWSVADDMWEAAGRPQDKTVVLKLRIAIMTELENSSAIKKTTSSNELGVWMKNRILAP